MRSSVGRTTDRRRSRIGAAVVAATLVGLLAAAGVVVPGQQPVAQAAPADLVPPEFGILPGPAPGGDLPGSWGPCVPDAGSTDNCAGWLIPPGAIVEAFPGTDDAPNVIVGGDFTAGAGSAETEGLLVVNGDAAFLKSYNVGVAGGGSGVVPAHRADMLVVGGDVTVANPSVDPNAGGNPANVGLGLTTTDGTSRYGTIHVGGTWNFRDPSFGAPDTTFGVLGNVDTANQDPPAETQNVLDADVSVLVDDGYTELFGGDGKMSRYSQLCYAELSTDTDATTVFNEGGALLLEHGTVSIADNVVTLTSTGSGDLVEFVLPGTLGSPGSTVEINVVGADGQTVLINTLEAGPVAQFIGDVQWETGGSEGEEVLRGLQEGRSILWNYPFSTDITLGGASQFPGSILVGDPGSSTEIGFSGANGRIYTPGDLLHTGTTSSTSGDEVHGYLFDGELGCIQAVPGTFSVDKVVSGDGADAVPADTTFTVGWEVTGPAGSPNLGRTGTVEITAEDPPVIGPIDLAEGDVVTFSEPTLPVVDGVDWGTPQIAPNPITIGAQDSVAEVVVTNVATLQRGGFTVTKAVTGDDGASTTSFEVTWTCDAENLAGDSTGTLTLADGDAVVVDGFPVGTTCTVAETTPADDAGTWADPVITPAEIVVAEDDGTVQVVTVTNDFTHATGGFEVVKELTGDGADAVPADATFTVGWEVTGPADTPDLGRTGTLEIPADGTPVAGPDDLRTGDEVTFTETGPAPVDGIDWGTAEISPNTLTVGDGTTATVTVTNEATLVRGGFLIVKDVTGDPGASTTEFTGTWTCDAENTDGDDTGTWTLSDGDAVVVDGFPVGTTCTIAEDLVTDDNGTWTTTLDPDSLTVAEGDPTATVVTVTNEFTSEVGAFSIAKEVTGDVGASVTAFTVDWTCTAPDDTVTAGSVAVSAGEASDPVANLPVGTVCAFGEATVDDPNGTWTAEITPSELVIGSDDPEDVAVVSVTNTFTVDRGGFTLRKEVTGDPGASTTEFTGTWTCDADNTDGDDTGTWTLSDGDAAVVDGFPVDTTCTIAEDPVTDDNGTWTTSIDPASLTIVEDGAASTVVTVTNEFTAVTTPSPSPSTSAPTPGPTTTPTVAPDDDLPRTGAEVAGAALLAATLVGLGTVALLVARRRRED